ncbi:MAG: hypothetical protein JNM94_09515 [Phycisphaerae bacterium]|nr:hypothetical protein [Phycisphaerae bacterium]
MTTAALSNTLDPSDRDLRTATRPLAHSSFSSRARASAAPPATPAPIAAASTCVVGLANTAAGVSLAVAVTNGTLAWPWLAAPVAAATIVLGGVALLRASRLARSGLDAIDLRLGLVASCVARHTPNALDGDDHPDLVEVEHAALVQILLVGVFAIAVLIGVTSFPSRVPWQQLVPAASLAWPAILRVYAVRRGREGRRLHARRLRDQLCDAALAAQGRRR